MGFLVGLVVGGITGGYIVKNNKDKALNILSQMKADAEEALELVKSELEKLKKG